MKDLHSSPLVRAAAGAHRRLCALRGARARYVPARVESDHHGAADGGGRARRGRHDARHGDGRHRSLDRVDRGAGDGDPRAVSPGGDRTGSRRPRGGGCGALVGVANGAMVTGLRITPFIVTLGTMSVLRGLAKGLAHEQKVDVDPAGLDGLMTAGGAWLPGGVWVTLGVAILAAGALAFTRFGRHVVAVGSNELTARLCGVAVGRVKITVYALAGLLAGVAGLMEFATLTVGDPTDSIGLELEVIAAVVIGGGSLSGGQGSVAGSLVGALLLTVIKSGSTHVGLPNWVQEILTGFIIVVAMALDRYRRREKG